MIYQNEQNISTFVADAIFIGCYPYNMEQRCLQTKEHSSNSEISRWQH